MKLSARGMYEFLGGLRCPNCQRKLFGETGDYRKLNCDGRNPHSFQWKYDRQDWLQTGRAA